MQQLLTNVSQPRKARPQVDTFISLFEPMLDCDSYFVLWGIRDPLKVAQMIASFAEMCGAARRSGIQFTATIEIPGDVKDIDKIWVQVAGILQRSAVISFYDGTFKRMTDAKGRLDGKLTFCTK
jgi:hypothetical protein